MVGDREKCIQAQMDVSTGITSVCTSLLTIQQEYLSKPLKQNQLIQTILKCATLGGALLEHNNDQRMAQANANAQQSSDSHDNFHTPEENTPTATPRGTPSARLTSKRPHLEVRGFTEAGHATGDSPNLLAPDGEGPVDRVSKTARIT